MKLPEEFKSWIEFAKKCDEVLLQNPEIETIQSVFIDHEGIKDVRYKVYIKDVKARAFDEIMNKVDFKIDHVMKLRDAALFRGYHFDEINSITDLLLMLNK